MKNTWQSANTYNIVAYGSYKYCKADHIQDELTNITITKSINPTANNNPFWIRSGRFTDEQTVPFFKPTHSYCHPAPELFARNKNSITWVDQEWPEWLWYQGPQFTNIVDDNTTGQWGGKVKYRDFLYANAGDIFYDARPETQSGCTQMANNTVLGNLPMYLITPKPEDYIKLKDIYAPAYGSASMEQYGKSVFDGACICKADSKGDLTVVLSSTVAIKLYFNKEPFSTSIDTGNISYKGSND